MDEWMDICMGIFFTSRIFQTNQLELCTEYYFSMKRRLLDSFKFGISINKFSLPTKSALI